MAMTMKIMDKSRGEGAKLSGFLKDYCLIMGGFWGIVHLPKNVNDSVNIPLHYPVAGQN